MGADPLTASLVVGSTGLNILSQIRQSESEQAIAQYNARLARSQAERVRAVATDEQFEEREDLREALARNRALAARGGVQFSGSPLQSQLKLIDDTARNIATIGENAELEAMNLGSRAEIFDFQRKEAARAGKLGIGASLVSGGADLVRLNTPKSMRKVGTVSKQKTITGSPRVLPARLETVRA